MNPTKHARTNYRVFAPFCIAAREADGYKKFHADGFMPLTVEYLEYEHDGHPVFSVCHYGKMNGDAMRDPDMTFALNEEAGTIEPLTYQNDYMGVYQEVYTADGESYRPYLRTSLDDFLHAWGKNLKMQGFDPKEQQEEKV